MPLMGHERRNAILQSLRGAERPVSGTALADAALADLGVDFISSGALTHSAPILDLSLKHLRMV